MSQIGLKIGVWNADGLTNKSLEMELFVKQHHIDVMLVSETHFCSTSYYQLRGYDVHLSIHPADRHRGGSAIIIKLCLKYYPFLMYRTPNGLVCCDQSQD